VQEQGAFADVVLEVEVVASRLAKTLVGALALVGVLHGVRAVRAAVTGVRVVLLT